MPPDQGRARRCRGGRGDATPAIRPRRPARRPAPPLPTVRRRSSRSTASTGRFGDNQALAGLDLDGAAGTITVLLGPNGAGKTTAIRMITGALDPDAGTVRTFGLDPDVDGEEVRRRCGVVSAKPALYDRLSGCDNLALLRRALRPRARRRRRRARSEAAAARFGIEHALDAAGRRLLDRHEDPPGPRPVGAARPRPAAVRRADVGPRPRVVPRRARADPGDDRRRRDRRHVHPPAARGRGPGRPGRGARGRHRPRRRHARTS